MEKSQTNFWEINFPDSKEREDAQSIYKRLTEIYSDKEDISSFYIGLKNAFLLNVPTLTRKKTSYIFTLPMDARKCLIIMGSQMMKQQMYGFLTVGISTECVK